MVASSLAWCFGASGQRFLPGVVFAPHAAACVPGRLTSQSGVALGGRGHNLNCAAGGRRCAGRRPGLVLGGRWRRRPVGWCGGCRCLLGGGVPCRLRGVAGVSPPLGDSAACGRRGKTGPHGGPEERSDPLRPHCARPPLPKGEVRVRCCSVGRGALTPPHKKGAAELCGARNTPNQSNYHIIF